ncbi:hypothetical protein [Acidovorax sp.]|uniref:hypothetical protein n=1 Tax=Acidovorax sp. TaxID=1872122 RepID=UPI0025B803EE|nr:hypothetical protein [Acidovorax sp.]
MATPGRKPLKAPPAPPAVNEVAIADFTMAADTMRELQMGCTAERDTLNRMIGRIQMGQAFGGLATALTLRELKSIKESKSYRNMAGQTGVDRRGLPIHDLGTWDGFCRALGFSRDKVDEDLRNLDAFGEEALDGLSAIGAGYRELKEYRKLPEDRKQALIEVAKMGDKEGFVELAEQIISNHIKEKEELQKAVEEGKQELGAMEKRVGVLRQQREDAEAEDARFAALGPDGQLAELQKTATDAARRAWVTILQLEAAMLKVQAADPLAAPFLAGLLKRVSVEVARVETALSLPSVSDVPADALEWLEYQAEKTAH